MINEVARSGEFAKMTALEVALMRKNQTTRFPNGTRHGEMAASMGPAKSCETSIT